MSPTPFFLQGVTRSEEEYTLPRKSKVYQEVWYKQQKRRAKQTCTWSATPFTHPDPPFAEESSLQPPPPNHYMICKYTNTSTQIQICKYKYTITSSPFAEESSSQPPPTNTHSMIWAFIVPHCWTSTCGVCQCGLWTQHWN